MICGLLLRRWDTARSIETPTGNTHARGEFSTGVSPQVVENSDHLWTCRGERRAPVDNPARRRAHRTVGVGHAGYRHRVTVTPATAATTTSTDALDTLLGAAVDAGGGTARPGQQAMARAVSTAVDSGEHLLVQAGTGTGKSLAYLAPALLVDGPVVISTATLALQSQLIDHDLPRLSDAVEPVLGRRPTFAVLKGRHHYLCLARLESSTEDEPDDTLFDARTRPGGGVKWLGEAGRLGKQVQRLREWAEQTSMGDRDELDPGVDDRAWRLVSMPARECVGAARCPFGTECFAEASRVRAR